MAASGASVSHPKQQSSLPVMRDRRVLGMLGREDVINYLRTLQEVQSWRAGLRL
jgi:hypothetical protein